MSHFDIFISYRRSVSADKAEHLMSLLEKAGYKNRISFDRENLTGLFDIEILRRIDACKDFVLLVGPGTFSHADEAESEKYRELARMNLKEFDAAQREMQARNEGLDFVRLEVDRAIEQGKNIVIVAEATSENFDFNKLNLPSDLRIIKRSQAVFYYNDKNFRFRSIISDVTKLLKSRKGGGTLYFYMAALLVLAMTGAAIGWYVKTASDLRSATTYGEVKAFSERKFLPGLRGKASERLREFDVLMEEPLTTDNATLIAAKYAVGAPDSTLLTAEWSEDVTLEQVRAIRELTDNMKKIGAATFVMGATDIPDNDPGEVMVRLTHPYYISQYEVSRGEWAAITGNPLPEGENPDLPATDISWDEAVRFIERLNELVGINGWMFSLPTEAQWEYAALGGDGGYGAETALPSRILETRGAGDPNGFDLFDMTGNAKEWVLDGYQYSLEYESPENPVGSGEQKVIKGASFRDAEFAADEPWLLSPRYRDGMHPDKKADDVGFRLSLVKVL